MSNLKQQKLFVPKVLLVVFGILLFSTQIQHGFCARVDSASQYDQFRNKAVSAEMILLKIQENAAETVRLISVLLDSSPIVGKRNSEMLNSLLGLNLGQLERAGKKK